MLLHRLSHARAPEFPGRMTWMNGPAVTLKELRGKVVLIDFWTYSCVNCHRTLPHLKRWHKLYEDKGLVIIGVHTPEFAFEKNPDNVDRAMRDLEIPYRTVLDPDYKIWNLYANQYWPRKYVIDKDGYIVFDHIGEGGYVETEMAIQKALKDIGHKELPTIPPSDAVSGKICYRTTPETNFGFLRGKFGNAQDYLPDTEEVFADTTEHVDDIPYLYGHWKVMGECVQHTRKLSIANEYLALKYSAFSVNVVAGTVDGRAAALELELDGLPLPEDLAGTDVRIGKDGKATVAVKEPRLYRLVNSDVYHRGTLKIKTPSANIQLFALTFGGCREE